MDNTDRIRQGHRISHCIICLFCAILFRNPVSAYPPIPQSDPANHGKNIQKTMQKLAAGGNVKILVLGQSISTPDNSWPGEVISYLEQQYPAANITYQNLAIAACAVMCMTGQVTSGYIDNVNPDLIIFHDYTYDAGDGDAQVAAFDNLIGLILEHTPDYTEMLVSSDHVHHGELYWHNLLAFELYPPIMEKHGVGYAEIRQPWLTYLSENYGNPAVTFAQCLRDEAGHLNDEGNYLLAGLLIQHLVLLDETPAFPRRAARDAPPQTHRLYSGTNRGFGATDMAGRETAGASDHSCGLRLIYDRATGTPAARIVSVR